MSRLVDLRQKHQQFIYRGFNWKADGDNLSINFDFLLSPNVVFQPQLLIKAAGVPAKKLPSGDLDNLVFHLGLIELISYWKAACSPEVIIEAGKLNSEQINWWQNLLKKGLGEFFFQNKVDFRFADFVVITSKGKRSFDPFSLNLTTDKSLVMVGGGKDSVVAIEVLKQLGQSPAAMVVNPTQAADDVIKTANLDQKIIILRSIDPRLIELNQAGYLNGHTPFSANLGFLSLLVGSVFGFSQLIAANERSAEEANVTYLNQPVNHQYSKTWEFEQLFRDYVKKYISPSLNYFSLVRPLWEIQISKIFSKTPQYFSVFKSCNRGQKDNVWCGNCPKCLSVYLLLAPFLKEKTKEIFGQNLLERKDLMPMLDQLIGKGEFKPFECVGTKEEIIASLDLLKSGKSQKILSDWGEDKFLSQPQKNLLKKLAYA